MSATSNPNGLCSEAVEPTAEDLSFFQLIDNLERRSRAYNALYGAGLATPQDVKTLTDKEVDDILRAASDVQHHIIRTDMHVSLMRLSPALLNYVAGGGL